MSKRLFVFKGSNYSRAAFFAARALLVLGPDAACSNEETALLLDCAHPYMSLYIKELQQRSSETYSDLRIRKSLYNVYAVLPVDLVNPKWEEWLLGKPEGSMLYSSYEASTFDYGIWHLCPHHFNIRKDPWHICLVPII
ncbi:hypothetical protein K443DRAFT_124852 [Laccaria amethystina LaAM-08-1]|uniref:Uncharacterized protein n=1 Tax=Laccaria amethystina LaAM-08-1 TaxID=1095629 RepID=A0A0C9WTQ6_9AGAR|nr:hypothetical protein K443DRAFT_124852 [Laccaria amethystina LaAM-08-1]